MQVILNGKEMDDVLKVTIEPNEVTIVQLGTVGFKVGDESEFIPCSSDIITTTVATDFSDKDILCMTGNITNRSAERLPHYSGEPIENKEIEKAEEIDLNEILDLDEILGGYAYIFTEKYNIATLVVAVNNTKDNAGIYELFNSEKGTRYRLKSKHYAKDYKTVDVADEIQLYRFKFKTIK